MKLSLGVRAVGITAITAIALTACGSNSNGGSTGSSGNGGGGGPSGSLSADGSTFQATIESQWASQYQGQCSGAQVTYTGDGSSAGIEQFGLGKEDFAGTDAVMDDTEQSTADQSCGSGSALTVPVTAGGIALIYNVKGVTDLKLTADTIAGIFEGKITKWNDPKIAADNSGAKLPNEAIKTYWRNDGSGTSNVFSGFLDAVAKSVWTLGASKQPAFPVGTGAAGSSGVVSAVKQTEGGITYAEVSYAKQNSLPTAQVKNTAGTFEAISADTVSQSIDSGFSVTGSGSNLAGALDFTTMTGYPISTVSYVMVCSKYKDSSKGALVKGYFDYVLGDGQTQADSLGYAPLPSDLVTKAKASIDSIT